MYRSAFDAHRAESARRNGAGGRRGGPTVRVGLLEPNQLLREGLIALIDATPNLHLAGAWGTAEALLDEVPRAAADVLLIDVKLPERASFAVLKALPAASPSSRVIVMVDCPEERCAVLSAQVAGARERAVRMPAASFSGPDDCLQTALKLGAQGVLRKNCAFADVVQAIRAVHSGQCWMELSTATRLAQQYLLTLRPNRRAATEAGTALTVRERQVVSLISHGRSNKEIARELQLGYSTVKNYVSNILEKLGLNDRTQIALYAIGKGPRDGS